MTHIDWSVFEEDSECEIACRCGVVYYSHAKLVTENGKLIHYTQKPCPGCGSDHGHTRRVSSDWETFTIRGEKK